MYYLETAETTVIQLGKSVIPVPQVLSNTGLFPTFIVEGSTKFLPAVSANRETGFSHPSS